MSLFASPVFDIAGLRIAFKTEEPMEVTEAFLPFLSSGEPDWEIAFRKTDRLPPFPENPVFVGQSYAAASGPDGTSLRLFFDAAANDLPFALGRYDWNARRIALDYLASGAEFVRESGSCFFYLALDALLLHSGRGILHAACVQTGFGGILFSGPSGIGKSTQSALWLRNEGARLLNGDRTVLSRENAVWRGFGSPYAGSSRVWLNESCDIRAVVMLEKSETCSIKRLGRAEAFRKVFSGMTVNRWDGYCVTAACDLAESIADEVPVFELFCTPDESAVETLKSVL